MSGPSAQLGGETLAPPAGNPRLLFFLPLVAFLAPLLHAALALKVPLSGNALLLAGFIVLLAVGLGLALSWVETRGQGPAAQFVRAALLSATFIIVFDLLFYPADNPSCCCSFSRPWGSGRS